MTISQTKASFSADESRKKAPLKKLPLQGGEKSRPRGSKDVVKKTTTRTSVTRSEIQEYWMQGYEHVQRTDKTTANIEQWQSAAMKSLEEKKVNDARWAQSWRQFKDQPEDQSKEKLKNQHKEQSEEQPSEGPKEQLALVPQLDPAKPCSSKTLEPLNFS